MGVKFSYAFFSFMFFCSLSLSHLSLLFSLFSLSIFNSYIPVSLLILVKLKLSIWAVSISAWWSQCFGDRMFFVELLIKSICQAFSAVNFGIWQIIFLYFWQCLLWVIKSDLSKIGIPSKNKLQFLTKYVAHKICWDELAKSSWVDFYGKLNSWFCSILLRFCQIFIFGVETGVTGLCLCSVLRLSWIFLIS